MLLCGLAWAGDGHNDAKSQEMADAASTSEPDPLYDVTGLPTYQGPGYRSLDSEKRDIDLMPEFHAFHHRPVDEVGYSPLTLADFRVPVPGRTQKEFNWERLDYPRHSSQVWHDDCHGFTVTAFFFTRDMVRDHIQRLVDEYYICEPDVLQGVIDYYAEVTPQCGEAISWVWFSVDDANHHYADKRENRYFTSYLDNFKDKFYLEFGLPKVQNRIDDKVHDFLYQYRDRGKHECGAGLKGDCPVCKTSCGCGKADCNDCPDMYTEMGDKALLCEDFSYHGFHYDVNQKYLYYPRKVVIEDITYDGVAQAYRWKFAWRFTDCNVDWLKQMCAYGEDVQFSLVLSDPHWYAHQELSGKLERDLLASVDPNTWGNVWPAGNLPFDQSCCDCPLPYCANGWCPQQPVGWVKPQPQVEVIPDMPEPDEEFEVFPEPEPEPEVEKVIGNG
jgi:hypothetical protein